MMKKSEVKLFGEESIAHVEEFGDDYAIFRDCDRKILAISRGFEIYLGCTIRTVYTGEEYGTGEIVLQADTSKGTETIYYFHD